MTKTHPLNRPDVIGAISSALVPLLLVLIGNGLIFATGWMDQNSSFDRLENAPPGWFVGLMWTLIYPLWGLARWRVRLYSTASRMLIGLMVWGFLYTIITGPAGPMTGAICNGISLLFVILASLLAARRDRIALFLMVPSIIWVVFANYLGLAALHAAPML
ncbi:MAG: hypothetical protein CME88_11330 [Hirschia sp.]|nr:hypothetical protein [Hirschia sp.]MBF18961.1 hypothetical protein [Hirschia sp.]|tara:strand:- start:20 stop:502 length:483 start_codon:yes stop_codon:yes gene_type:complete